MLTVDQLRPILRAAWGADTCDPHDLPDWRPDNPSRGQCGVTALVVQDLLGGDLVLGEVFVDEAKAGHHYWNRLPDGRDVDLTADQFHPGEVVTGAKVQRRPPGPPGRCREQYELLSRRVRTALDSPRVVVPQSFLDMPRWWTDGPGWLETVPELVRTYGDRWRLTVTGAMTHGSNAAVIPVARAGDSLILRLTPPGPGVADQVRALRFWNGRGTVRLIDADPAGGAMLLERLAIGASARDLPVAEAMPVLGRMMRRLAVPAPPDVPSTADVVAARMTTLPAEWERHGRPFPEAVLRRALAAGSRLSHTDSGLAVNGDLHSEQVLRGEREPWLTVDPVLMRGDIAFDLGRILWTRIDEMADADEIVGHLEAVVEAAGIDRGHGRDWAVFRTVDYWLWGLSAGLTEDPERCRRLLLAAI